MAAFENNSERDVRAAGAGTSPGRSLPGEQDVVRQRFIEEAGRFTQSLGLGRIIGQIYAYCYFCPSPCTLDELAEHLAISKGSASTMVRQLESWGALRRTWIKGDRKDYYEASDAFGRIVRNAARDIVGRSLDSVNELLEETGLPAADPDDDDIRFVQERIEKLRAFRDRTQGLWNSPIVKMLMKAKG